MNASALLADIFDNPDDNTPRLIYADWLEEHGDEADRERAEFIRLQCRLARMTGDEPGWFDLHDREHELLRKNESQWEGEFPEAVRGWIDFRRGFASVVTLTGSAFLKCGAELFLRSAFDRLVLLNPDEVSARLCRSPCWPGSAASTWPTRTSIAPIHR